MDFQPILTDLGRKFPCLQYLLRAEYASYLNTAGTILLGWLIISWISYIVWVLLAPLTVTVIAIILISPMTAKWCLKQTVPGLQVIFNESAEKVHTIFTRVRG
ncbi:uncharacterized protein LOC143266025 [Megachile rotundata]|uniref:uncharacterized protein LOC143266025 n=1 Tax=Megachile rotundata TaxID=143995 RepID=UPI003FD27929